ncbi:host nuclease inhibitor protein [Brucella anthropi]|uniref:host nuclease inhibitor protein n=1 Tax=Brucella anthropi TaxID=529 RepID=UPI00235E421A|nr:host nuclease inhibitor protein [Brucella anthropi]
MAIAYCWRGGDIQISRRLPKGALKLGSAHGILLKKAVSVCARHSYDGHTLLVPGIPEADNDTEALEAVARFREQLARRLERKKKKGELL